MRKTLVICLDGCGPDYLERSETPCLDDLGRRGFQKIVSSMIPSVTNVNNVSICTGAFPEAHGITTNFYFDRDSRQGDYMESADFILAKTMHERAGALGMRTAMLTSKRKLRLLLDRGADVCFSAEDAPAEAVAAVGPPPPIYSIEVNPWVLRACAWVMREVGPQMIYCSTTDFAMHKFAPEEAESQRHMRELDRAVGDIATDNPDVDICITADHGMLRKTRTVDLGRFLKKQGIEADVLPIIKDRYVQHHQNRGGAVYVYLRDPSAMGDATAALAAAPGVEEVYAKADAASEFHLHSDRIGDLFVLGAADVVFGELETIEEESELRSHGSRHESRVPVICSSPSADPARYEYNMDIVRDLPWRDGA